uniref:Transmembrane protein n=1 Tax=Mesocestoides corti TaxID=53468 RepID=A0A5K3FHX9_MESCO
MLGAEILTPLTDVCVMLITLPYIDWVMLGIAAVYGMRIVAFCVRQVTRDVDEMPPSPGTSGTSESAMAGDVREAEGEEEDGDSKEADVLERPLLSTPEIQVLPPSMHTLACATPVPREAHEASRHDYGVTKSQVAVERIGHEFEVNEIVHSPMDRDVSENDTTAADWSVGGRDRRLCDGDKECNFNNEMARCQLLSSEFVHVGQ